MILYITDSEYAIRELLEGIRTFSKKAGYKINVQKSVASLCTSYKPTEDEAILIWLTLHSIKTYRGNILKTCDTSTKADT